MSQEPEIINGGESPLASKLQSEAESTGTQQLQSGENQRDGGAAPVSGRRQASPSTASSDSDSDSDASGVASSGGIMRPRSV